MIQISFTLNLPVGTLTVIDQGLPLGVAPHLHHKVVSPSAWPGGNAGGSYPIHNGGQHGTKGPSHRARVVGSLSTHMLAERLNRRQTVLFLDHAERHREVLQERTFVRSMRAIP